MGRVVLASVLSLAMALGVTACSNDYTVSYVYMTTSKSLPHGLINAYQVDYQSGSAVHAGRLAGGCRRARHGRPGGRARTSCSSTRSTTSTPSVVEFAIGTDGKLYPENTYNIAGSLPTAAAIDAAGKFLYVTFTYQNNPNGIAAVHAGKSRAGRRHASSPSTPTTRLGTPFTVNAGRNPVGIATSPTGNYVYVIEQDAAHAPPTCWASRRTPPPAR